MILPVDFEEAWKVSGVWLCFVFVYKYKKADADLSTTFIQQTVKRSDETHEFCEFYLLTTVYGIWFMVISSRSVVVVYYRGMLCPLTCHINATHDI